MLDSMPNARNVSPSYRFGLVDSMMRDEEVWGRYGPGFSYAVVARAIREVRRTSEFAPSQAAFLKLCAKHRSQFQELAGKTTRLMESRSQRGRRLTWDRMKGIAERYLPYPRILHPWPEQRFLVTIQGNCARTRRTS
jgi:hypothetical protein